MSKNTGHGSTTFNALNKVLFKRNKSGQQMFGLFRLRCSINILACAGNVMEDLWDLLDESLDVADNL